MKLANFFGLSDKTIIAGNCKTTGKITAVKKCWWLKVNTKSVRLGPLDGAEFPHIIHFTYAANGEHYCGKRWLSHSAYPPRIGEEITVYYERENAANYAAYIL